MSSVLQNKLNGISDHKFSLQNSISRNDIGDSSDPNVVKKQNFDESNSFMDQKDKTKSSYLGSTNFCSLNDTHSKLGNTIPNTIDSNRVTNYFSKTPDDNKHDTTEPVLPSMHNQGGSKMEAIGICSRNNTNLTNMRNDSTSAKLDGEHTLSIFNSTQTSKSTNMDSNVSLSATQARQFPGSSSSKSLHLAPVKETRSVLLEYDPISRRKVLNSYEILREIGRGEHGKVKLAKDLIQNDLVAIKIVNRKSKKERPALKIRRDSKVPLINEYELKIKREIAIMKKCRHKHIVALREVLDDVHSFKIYLILEFMAKGEIKWKKFQSDYKMVEVSSQNSNDTDIPCCGNNGPRQPHHRLSYEGDLLSNEYSPNLTFKQSRKIFRDVLLGLEYLHKQGIVHRDIKPANLLVSADNVVKISDFGVSFASSLNENEEGHLVNEFDLNKTAGTPAFFAPELCRLGDDSNASNESIDISLTARKIDYKIDIWALGVTLYCLLFGKVPFNAESEFELFQVIVSQTLDFPRNVSAFNSPGTVHIEELKLAKDLLSRMLDKDPETRADIKEIKEHPFTLMDLDEDIEGLNDLINLNNECNKEALNFSLEEQDVLSKEEISNAVIGVGTRIKRSLVRALRAGGLKDSDVRTKFAALKISQTRSESTETSSGCSSTGNLNTHLDYDEFHNDNNSMILSEGLPINQTTWMTTSPQIDGTVPNSPLRSKEQDPSHSSLISSQPIGNSASANIPSNFQTPYSFAGIREGKSFLHDMIDPSSNNSSRRGSSAGLTLSEVPQIETKRNVGGDLYLANQSVVETFKGIQQQDDKRRRSSLFSINSQPGVHPNKGSLSTDNSSGPHQLSKEFTPTLDNNSKLISPMPVPGLKTNNNGLLKEGSEMPMDDEEDRLPKWTKNDFNMLPESSHVASCGSSNINSDVMREPFSRIGPTKKSLSKNDSIFEAFKESSFISLPLSESFASLDSINDDYLESKYQQYARKSNSNSNSKPTRGLGDSKRKSSLSDTDLSTAADSNTFSQNLKNFNFGNSMKNKTCNNVKGANGAPNFDEEIAPKSSVPVLKNNYNSSSSLSYSSYSSSSDEERENNDDSEEENLTLAFHSKLTPVTRPNFLSLTGRAKSHDSNLPYFIKDIVETKDSVTPVIFHNGPTELEDVPHELLNNTPAGNDGNKDIVESDMTLSNSNPTLDNKVSFAVDKLNFRQASNDGTNDFLRENIFNNQFNNHYKKAPVYSPFPRSKHLDNDKNELKKLSDEKYRENRPNNFRSNSVSVGILQHNVKHGN